MDRITNGHLEHLVERLNKLTGQATEPWTKQKDGSYKANVGNYHLSGAYGGVCLHQMVNEGGGVTTPLTYGHVPKRELYNALRAFVSGVELGKGK